LLPSSDRINKQANENIKKSKGKREKISFLVNFMNVIILIVINKTYIHIEKRVKINDW
jgi:hypothetical protein